MLFKWPPADEEGPSARNHGEIVAVVVLRGYVVMGEVCDHSCNDSNVEKHT